MSSSKLQRIFEICVFEDEMQEIIKTYTYAYSGEEI